MNINYAQWNSFKRCPQIAQAHASVGWETWMQFAALNRRGFSQVLASQVLPRLIGVLKSAIIISMGLEWKKGEGHLTCLSVSHSAARHQRHQRDHPILGHVFSSKKAVLVFSDLRSLLLLFLAVSWTPPVDLSVLRLSVNLPRFVKGKQWVSADDWLDTQVECCLEKKKLSSWFLVIVCSFDPNCKLESTKSKISHEALFWTTYSF